MRPRCVFDRILSSGFDGRSEQLETEIQSFGRKSITPFVFRVEFSQRTSSSRLVIDALKQEKERVNDLESDLQVLQKQLRHAQTQLSEQISPIDRPAATPNNNVEFLRSVLVEK